MLVQGTSLQAALATLQKFLSSGMQDWLIVGIVETQIMDVFRYSAPQQKEQQD